MKTAVITIVHGRADHLRRQLDGLNRSIHVPDVHVVVAMNDPGVDDVVTASRHRTKVVHLTTEQGPLPLAEARNAGAAAAADADLLVFLDVDCIPGRTLLGRYDDVAARPEHRASILCGAVTYLPAAGAAGYPDDLAHLADPHPARPAPPAGEVVVGADYALFWSLSFALSPSTWRRIGGFDTRYRGYGGEDTDFGQSAAAAGVPLLWVGGADAFHQYHSTTDPPVQHLDDILRNASIFHRRWGWWPMEGWLSAFHDRGLITREADGRPVATAVRAGS